MGRKRNRTWKYLYLPLACMTFVSLIGCVALKEMEAKGTSREHLIRAQTLLDRGDYEGSLKENQKALSLYDNIPPGDEALFNTGLIHAHYAYPKRDNQKALDNFKRVVKLFPQSQFARQAKIWMGILQDTERLNKEIEESKKSIRKLQQENQKLLRDIEDLKNTVKKSKQVDIEIDEKKKEISK